MSTTHPRSMLFVSGEKAERFPKAMAAGADLVCIDLEDAVHPGRKAEARAAVLGWLADELPRLAGPRPGIALRINGVRTREGLRDLAALAETSIALDWLLCPKVEDAGDVQCVQAWVGARFGAGVALVETPLGVENAFAIARAGAGLGALMLGGADLCAELGARFGWDGLLHARGRLVNAAKAAGLQAWDVPHIDLPDLDGLHAETRGVLELGFDCKTAIHPTQVGPIHAAFKPSARDAEWARVLLQAVPGGGASGAFIFDGRLVDAPLLKKARRIAELAAIA